jgi:hypothetical protein
MPLVSPSSEPGMSRRNPRQVETKTLFTYQDDLLTPGISPLSASPRKQSLQMPNLRRKARGRPQSWQRLCCRVENFGFFLSLAIFAVVAIFSFCLSKNLLLRPERHAQMLEQRPRLIVICRGGHDGHVHALHLLHFGVINLREDELVTHAEGVIAAPVE